MKLLSFLFGLIASCSAMANDSSTKILASSPAKKFYDSSPLGNGRLGAMVFGGFQEDRIVLNESTVWSGSPQDGDRAEAYKVLPEIRRLLLNDEPRKAQDLLQQNFVCKGPGSSQGKNGQFGCYQMLGNLRIKYHHEIADRYTRYLDLETALCVQLLNVDRLTFLRESFISAPDQVFIYRVACSEAGKISATISLDRPENAQIRSDGDRLVLDGKLPSGIPGVDGIHFQGQVKVILRGGTQTANGHDIEVRDADEVLILVAAGTSMFDKNFERTCTKQLTQASTQTYAELKMRHIKDYQQFFNRVELNLPDGKNSLKPTVERLGAMAESGTPDPTLCALYFNFGRYLLISSSRPDSPLPANLQGLWAEEISTPWNADFHLNINVQMNYWPAEVCNLSDCAKPLLNFVPKLIENGSKTAKAYYGARGWVAHTITNPWHFTSPGEGAGWGSTVTCGAWLTEHQWDHYAFTGDKSYLQSAYPSLKEASLFFLDMLVAEPKHGWLVTAPSNSPENTYIHPTDGGLNTCMGPTMDQQIVRELFENTIKAGEILGIDAKHRAELKTALLKLAPMQIAPDGRLQEWLEPYKEAEPTHRHTSHLYGLYPSNQITVDGTPDLAAAARKTLDTRGDDGTGWSLAWKMNFWARLQDGNRAMKIFTRLLRPTGVEGYNYSNGGGTYSNLFDAHPPFQIDGNFGATAAVAEMLLQSKPGEVTLLPALPDQWASEGSVKGLKARGNITVDVAWKDGKITAYKVHGANSKSTTVKFGKGRK